MPSRAALAAVVAAALGVFAPSALAAPPSTLTGQVFSALAVPFAQSIRIDCEPGDAPDTLDVRFRATSTTQDPYAGSYVETGELVLKGNRDEFTLQVIRGSAEFTIDSAAGQVTGKKRFVSHVAGSADSTFCGDGGDPQTGLNLEHPAQFSYSATITTPGGVFTDRGTAPMEFFDTSVSYPTEFTERFTSGLSATEQQHSVLFGKRTPGGSWSAMSANTKRASPFVFYFPGRVTRIHAYIDGNGATSGSQVVRAVLYRRDAATGGPGAYIARSFEFTVPAGMSARWIPFWLAPPAQLQPGVYWLGLQSAGQHGVARYAWDSVPNSRHYNVDIDADGPSDPFGSAFSDDQQMSIFAFGSY